MITKKNIRVLTIAALLAVAVVFGVYGCPGLKPHSPATPTPTPAQG